VSVKSSLEALKRPAGTCHQKEQAVIFGVAYNHPGMASRPPILKLCENGQTTTTKALSFALHEQETWE
jgi:hypothetical protein